MEGHHAYDANDERDRRAVADIGPGREQDQRGHADHLDSVYCHVLTMCVREGRQSAEAFLTMACANASRLGLRNAGMASDVRRDRRDGNRLNVTLQKVRARNHLFQRVRCIPVTRAQARERHQPGSWRA